jgi:hypothetical protein
MTHDPSPLAATMLAEVVRLPYSIKRSTAELYWDLLQTVLAEGGHTVALDRIEGDSVKGWFIHFHCQDPATIDMLRELEERTCHPNDPLSLL